MAYSEAFQGLLGDLSRSLQESGAKNQDFPFELFFTDLRAKKDVPFFTMGVGKSGNIAQKVAATLSSTGTPCFFLDPVEAFHGSLGLVAEGSVVLAFSNSGETQEILDLLPHLDRRGVLLVAFVGNKNSRLAGAAKYWVDCSVAQEICPLNLAPTTSTLVSLAMADALAVMLMQQKGIVKEDFAKNHPSGQLGKKLTLVVDDLMHQPAPLLEKEAPFFDVLAKITQFNLGAVFITNPEDQLLGIITDGDLRRFVEKGSELKKAVAGDLMSSSPLRIAQGSLAFEALREMELKGKLVSVLPVVDPKTKVVGAVSLHDLVRAGLV